jgi:LmbE family N-acetylglucosaminyl deacetylase
MSGRLSYQTENNLVLRILAIHAHPDDIEFQCAGTLVLLRERGHHITLATMTAGDCGSAELSREEIASIRREEARRSADLLGADYTCLEFDDLAIVDDLPSRRRVTECLRRARPDIVITAPPVDYMSDHEMTSLLVRQATFNAPIPNFRTHDAQPAPATESIPHLYYVDPLEGADHDGRPVVPGFHVDISSVFDLKREMLACHASQRDWLLRQHGIDEYLEAQRRWSAKRGQEIGVPFAEGFRQHRGHPYPQDNLLLDLIQSQVSSRESHHA